MVVILISRRIVLGTATTGFTRLIITRRLTAFTGLVHAKTPVLLAPVVSFAINNLGTIGLNKLFSRVFSHPSRNGLLSLLARV